MLFGALLSLALCSYLTRGTTRENSGTVVCLARPDDEVFCLRKAVDCTRGTRVASGLRRQSQFSSSAPDARAINRNAEVEMARHDDSDDEERSGGRRRRRRSHSRSNSSDDDRRRGRRRDDGE